MNSDFIHHAQKMNSKSKLNKKIAGKQRLILADNRDIVFSDEPQLVKCCNDPDFRNFHFIFLIF